ncbi:MAG TPA: hypothetical protein VKA13_03420, partial [Gammaproteobacteria bacterium]|nr:hypothetical protein [Gammaproteobacteria bacterium]
MSHIIETRYGLNPSQVLFYNGSATTSASLASSGTTEILGATVLDPTSPENRNIFLNVGARDASKRELVSTLGHEIGHLDYNSGRGYLLFSDSATTQEGLSDAAGGRLAELLGQQDSGIWATGDTSAWQAGLLDSPYTGYGTLRANDVGNATVDYRQLNLSELKLADENAGFVQRYAARRGVSLTREQAKARIERQLLRFVDKKAYNQDAQKRDELVISVLGMKGHDEATGYSWDYRNYAKTHPGEYSDPNQNSQNTVFYSPELANVDFGLTPKQLHDRKIENIETAGKAGVCFFSAGLGCAVVGAVTVGEGAHDLSRGRIKKGSIEVVLGGLGFAASAAGPAKSMLEATQGARAFRLGSVTPEAELLGSATYRPVPVEAQIGAPVGGTRAEIDSILSASPAPSPNAPTTATHGLPKNPAYALGEVDAGAGSADNIGAIGARTSLPDDKALMGPNDGPQLPQLSTYQERINQTPIDGRWAGQRGESTFYSNKPEVNDFVGEGINYSDGYPDLSP